MLHVVSWILSLYRVALERQISLKAAVKKSDFFDKSDVPPGSRDEREEAQQRDFRLDPKQDRLQNNIQKTADREFSPPSTFSQTSHPPPRRR